MAVDVYNAGVKIVAKRTVAKYLISLRDDGILHCHVFNNSKWVPEDCKLLFQAIGEMVDFKKVPLLVTFGSDVMPSVEGSTYWSDPRTCCKYFSAEATIVNNFPLKILGNFHIRKNKRLNPTEIFRTEKEAVKWLKTFL